jgi:tetratricopeptide (TPR) repeat protein
MLKGYCLYEMRRPDQALSAWQRTLEIEPRHVWASNNIGCTLRDRKNYDEALTWFDRALMPDPGHPTVLTNKAGALFALNRASEAKPLLEDAVRRALVEKDAETLFMAALVVSEELHDAQRALELLDQAGELGLIRPELDLNRAEMMIRLGQLGEGRTRATAVASRDVDPIRQTVATFLVYASLALEGDLVAADRCFADFAERIVELARVDGDVAASARWRYDGFLDMLVGSPASLATKFALAAAIDLQGGELVSPALVKLRERLPMIRQPNARPAMAARTAL